MNEIIENQQDGDFFHSALDLINHGAAVSRIFWPPGSRNKHNSQRAQRRGEILRKSLGLASGHTVQNRALRDHFEHFDERLDDWVESSKHRNIVQRFIGPKNAFSGPTIENSDIIHHYDPATKIFSFRGEQFNIQELVSGLSDIYQRASDRIIQLEANKGLQADAEDPRS